MDFKTITYRVADSVAHLTLSRPARTNALNGRMIQEINGAMDLAERNTAVRVIVVAGAGQAFSSGFDLKEQMELRPTGFDQWKPILRKDFDVIMRFWHCPKPTIAAVRGPCLAGAFELTLACDMTIASNTAFFGEPELKFGAGIVVMLLPWLVGPKIAKEIIFLGEDRLSVARARELGIVKQDRDRRLARSGDRACGASPLRNRSRAREADEARHQLHARTSGPAGCARSGARRAVACSCDKRKEGRPFRTWN